MDCAVQVVIGDCGRTLRIGGELDIRATGKLLSALREFLESDSARGLDLKEVESCDAAVLQLFCAATASARNAGRALEFENISDGLLQTAAALGVALPTPGGNGAI